jgi:hypothetical protein
VRVRKQKTDREDAQLILQLLLDRSPQSLGAELGGSRCAATAVASTPDGAGAHPDYEPVASSGLNEGLRCEKRLWRKAGRKQLESFPLAPRASRRRRDLLKLLGSAHSEDCRVDASDRAGSGKMSGSVALADASWSGCTDGVGLRVDHRPSPAISVWQPDRELPGTNAFGGVERTAAPAGTHHETRQLSVALLVRFLLVKQASHGALLLRPAMAQQIFPPGNTRGAENRDGSPWRGD